MSVDAPMSHGQLYSWREVQTYPRQWLREANLPAMWILWGLSAERVDAALRRLVELHEPLRTTYHECDGELVQRVHEPGPLPVTRVDRHLTDGGDPDRTTDELVAIPFATTGELGWRGMLVSTDGAPIFLALSFSHLILDVWSIQILHARFRQLAEDLDAVLPPAPSPRELAHEQRTEAWRARGDAAERYWTRILADRPGGLPTLGTGVTRPRVQATLHSHHLGELAAKAARQHGATPPAVIMAMVAAALSRHTDSERVTVSVMSSNRFAAEHRDVVGTMNQLVPVAATVDHAATLAEHIRKVHWAAAKAYRYSSYDLDRITALAARTGAAPEHGCWFNHLFPCWFNYLQLDDQAPGAVGTPAELAWTPLAREYGQPFDVRVSLREGRTSVALRTDPDVLPADAVTDILRAVALGVRLAVTDPEHSVKDLWSGRTDRLSPTLFPF